MKDCTHREVIDGVALAAVPLVSADGREKEGEQRSHKHNAHGHARIVQIVCMHKLRVSLVGRTSDGACTGQADQCRHFLCDRANSLAGQCLCTL